MLFPSYIRTIMHTLSTHGSTIVIGRSVITIRLYTIKGYSGMVGTVWYTVVHTTKYTLQDVVRPLEVSFLSCRKLKVASKASFLNGY